MDYDNHNKSLEKIPHFRLLNGTILQQFCLSHFEYECYTSFNGLLDRFCSNSIDKL